MNLSTQMAKRVANRPYRLLAQFYDQLSPYAPAMNRHARQQILGKILLQVRSVCDLACGTGTTAIDFARRGCKVFAVDNSPTMCRLAREKARRTGLPVRVLCADMRSLRLPEAVGLVTCEFASLNHVSRKTDLAQVLRTAGRVLRPGGYFLFDINTPRSFAEQYAATQWFEARDFKLVLRGSFNRRRGKARLDFEWFMPRGSLWRHHREQVENICWSDGEIRRGLRRAGFSSIRVWDGMDVRPRIAGARRGFDTYYLAQKSLNQRRKN